MARRVRNGESIAPFNIGPLFSKHSTGKSWAPIVPGKIMSPTQMWGPRHDRPTDNYVSSSAAIVAKEK